MSVISNNLSRSGLNYFISTLAVGLLMVNAGNVISWPSPTIPLLQSPESPLQIGLPEAAAISYTFYLGTTAGVLIVWPLLNYMGRRDSLLINGSIYALSWSILFFTDKSIWVIYTARFIAGMAQAIAMAIGPVYMVEISKVKWRQAVGNGLQFFVNMGLLTQYSAGPHIPYLTLVTINLSIAVIFLFLFGLVSCETPYYHMLQGRRDKAAAVLFYYRKNPSIHKINDELDLIEKSVINTSTMSLCEQLRLIFKDTGNLRALYLALGLTYFFVFSGVSQLIAFSETVFRLTKTNLSPSLCTLTAGGAKVLGGLVLLFLVRLFGMKNMIVVSSTVSGIAMFFLGLHFFLLNEGYNMDQYEWVPLIVMIVYFLFITIGVSFMTQYFRAEIFSTKVKPMGIALQEMFNCILLEVCSLFFTNFLHAPHIPFWLFSASLLIAAPFVTLLMPDTSKMNLNEIQDWLNGKKIKNVDV